MIIRCYAVAAPSHRVIRHMARMNLITGPTHHTVADHDRCLILCRSPADEVLIRLLLDDPIYEVGDSTGRLMADEAWHEEIAQDIAAAGYGDIAVVHAIIGVALPAAGHGLMCAALAAKGIAQRLIA